MTTERVETQQVLVQMTTVIKIIEILQQPVQMPQLLVLAVPKLRMSVLQITVLLLRILPVLEKYQTFDLNIPEDVEIMTKKDIA